MSKFNKYSGKVSFVVSGEEISLNRVKTEKLQELMNYTKDSETILVFPKTGMKFVSPFHLGTICRCMCPANPAPPTFPTCIPMLNPSGERHFLRVLLVLTKSFMISDISASFKLDMSFIWR